MQKIERVDAYELFADIERIETDGAGAELFTARVYVSDAATKDVLTEHSRTGEGPTAEAALADAMEQGLSAIFEIRPRAA